MATEHIARIVLFLVVSAGLARFSWASLRAPRSHGFYRFFAWECILGLLLLNAGTWFRDPLSLTQLISWFLLLVSGYLVLHGVYLLRRLGGRDSKRQDAPLIGLEKTANLVTSWPGGFSSRTPPGWRAPWPSPRPFSS